MDRVAHVGAGVSPAGAPGSSSHGLRRVAIIGGGYAGMAAAVSLTERGIKVSVFESAKLLGGRARRIDYRGEVLDNGQHILSGAYSELLRLMTLVGVGSNATVRIPLTLNIPPQFSLRAPRWIAPLHLAWALLSASGLSWPDRIAAIRFMRAMKSCNFQVDPAASVETLLTAHRQTANLIRFLWQPLTISALNTPINIASAQVLASVLRDTLASRREASDLILPQTDLSALFPDAAAIWLASRGSEIHLGRRVRSIAKSGEPDGAFEIATDTIHVSFDAVILAIGPHQFDSISLPPGSAPTAPFAYEPIVTLYLKFDQRVRLPSPMLGQVNGLAQWFFDRRTLSSGGHDSQLDDGLIAAVISASGPHEELPQEQLAQRVLEELARHTGPLPPLAWQKVVAEKFATFSCTMDVQERRPHTGTATPGLFLAGDYTAGDYPATLEGAVRSGVAAAQQAASFLARS